MNPERPIPREYRQSPEERRFFPLGKLAELAMKFLTRKFEVHGRENIPEGEALVITNHSSHIDGWAVVAALKDHDIGIVARDLPERRKTFDRILKWLSITKVREVASHLLPEDRQALANTQTALGQVIARESDPSKRREDLGHNIFALREIVENLIKGKKIIYFPEGGFYKEGDSSLRTPTEGAVALSRLYKKKTGRELPILPIGTKGGETVLGSNPAGYSVEDWTKAVTQRRGEVELRIGQAFHLQESDDFKEVFRERLSPLIGSEER